MPVPSPSPARAAEHALLRRCFARESGAWDTFVERYGKLIWRVVHDTLGRTTASGAAPPDEAEEVFHATFFALVDRDHRKLRSWKGDCTLASWIRLVTASVTIDHLRERRRAPLLVLDASVDGSPSAPSRLDLLVDDDAVAAEDLLERVDTIRRIRQALAMLPEPDRDLLERLYRDDNRPGDVAEALGVRPGTLYTRKNRALARLREAVEQLESDSALSPRAARPPQPVAPAPRPRRA